MLGSLHHIRLLMLSLTVQDNWPIDCWNLKKTIGNIFVTFGGKIFIR